MRILQPPGWARPKGFAHGVAVKGGTTVYIAGQIGSAPDGTLRVKDFAGQFRQALANILAVLAQSGGRPEHVVRMTWYVLDRDEYAAALKDLGGAWRELMGRHYPAMAVLQVSGLVEPEARLEIEATAVVPEAGTKAVVPAGLRRGEASSPEAHGE
jgi:enamine deaminase RidA (YjgF/YER057c/UK114 family)